MIIQIGIMFSRFFCFWEYLFILGVSGSGILIEDKPNAGAHVGKWVRWSLFDQFFSYHNSYLHRKF